MARRALSPPSGLGTRLSTGRLLLRPPLPRDAPAIARALARNAVHLAPTTPPRSIAPDDVARRVAAERAAFAGGAAFVLYAFLPDDEAEVVGKVALSAVRRGPIRSGNIGYWIDRDHLGRGLGREAVAAAVDLGLAAAGLHRLVAAIQPWNRPSIALAERLGFRSDGRTVTLPVGSVAREHHLYALGADEWDARGPAPRRRR